MDKVFTGFVERQVEAAAELSGASDLVAIQPLSRRGGLPQHFLIQFKCAVLVKIGTGEVTKAGQCAVGVYFPEHHLRSANPYEVLTWLGPDEIFHPNIRPPHICVGETFMAPGTGIVEIAYQLFAIITFNNFSAWGLNADACQWARNHTDVFPIDRRPLKRRAVRLEIQTVVKKEITP